MAGTVQLKLRPVSSWPLEHCSSRPRSQECGKSLWLFLFFQTLLATEDHKSWDFRSWCRHLCSEARAAPTGLQQSQTLGCKSGICTMWPLGYIYCRKDKTNQPSKHFSVAVSLSLKRRGGLPRSLNELDGFLAGVGHMPVSESLPGYPVPPTPTHEGTVRIR